MTSDIINAVAGDVMGAYGIPGAGTAGATGMAAWRKLTSRRVDRARAILVEELSRGSKSLYDIPEDELAAASFRYMRAAIEGTARLNLRLLASTVAGQVRDGELYADDFLRWADLIAGLRREEIIVLATFYREWTSFDGPGVNKLGAWPIAQQTLNRNNGIDKATSDAYATACLRTGLLRMVAGMLDGGHSFFPTKLLGEFIVLADIEGVLARDTDQEDAD
jgi:hypothetical protein